MDAALIILGFYLILAVVIFTSKNNHHGLGNFKILKINSIKPPPPPPVKWKVK